MTGRRKEIRKNPIHRSIEDVNLGEMSERLSYLLFFLILTETLGRHASYYYSDVAKIWIVVHYYEF
jgi:hypothetical protein